VGFVTGVCTIAPVLLLLTTELHTSDYYVCMLPLHVTYLHCTVATVQPLHNDLLYSNILIVAMLLAFPLLVHTQNNNILFITV
jgi:hypothetical protein